MRRFVLVAVVAGVVVSLNFDPVALPFSAVVGVAAFFALACRLAESALAWWRVALVGVVFGLAFFGPLIWWMNAVSHGAYAALTLVQALYFAPVLLGLRLVARLPWWPVAMPLVWTLGESARSAVPFSGFPWGRLAHITIDTPLDGYVRWVGEPMTSFIVALVAAGLAWLMVRPRERILYVAAGAAAIFLIGALLSTGLAGGDRGETAEIAIVQGNVPGTFLTWRRGEIFELHAAETVRLARRIAAGKVPRPDLVLWPENATDVDPFHDRQLAARIESLAARLRAPILVGGLFDGPTVNTAYNAGVVWTASGPQDRYVKRKLVPYGEYVPFRRVLGPVVPKFDRFIPRDMLPGDQPNLLSAGPVRLGDTICWDIAFDGLLREAVTGGAQVIVVQTSNASFTGTAQPAQQFKIARLRAIETGRWVLIPSTNGISAIVDATGHVVARAPMHRPALLSADVPLAAGSTVGVMIGHWLQYALLASGVAALGMAWRRS
ncbi:MAG TPA: apolipoprotein N-acyltransferase [Aeromicrobium sp.]|nr:apolipoprotein N-acyltransferase [Aeromicrobium sp.]